MEVTFDVGKYGNFPDWWINYSKYIHSAACINPSDPVWNIKFKLSYCANNDAWCVAFDTEEDCIQFMLKFA